MGNNLSKDTKVIFYDYICRYEEELSKGFGCFDWSNENLRHFIEEHRLVVGPDGKSNRKKIQMGREFILFDNKKPDKKELKGMSNDTAHNLLRHIRNAMAHGLICKNSKNDKFLLLKDYNSAKNVSMEGKITLDNLVKLINLLIATK